MQNNYDVVIVGAGPIGLACGIQAKMRGLHHIIIEKGCLVNSIFNYPKNMTFFSTSDRLEIGAVPFISHSDKPTRREALEYFRRVKKSWQLNVNYFERVLDIQGEIGHFKIITEKSSYTAAFVIVATGYYDNPNLLGVPGEELPKVKHYYDEPHPYADHRVAIVGAANSAIDVALETFRKGAAVTMIIRESELRPAIKYWARPDIENRIKEGSITAYFKSTIQAIRPGEIDVQTPTGLLTLENDFVFAMTGYHPDYDFLNRIGITIARDDLRIPCFNSGTFETNKNGLFLAGVVCCGMDSSKWSIENSIHHADLIFDYIQMKGAGKN